MFCARKKMLGFGAQTFVNLHAVIILNALNWCQTGQKLSHIFLISLYYMLTSNDDVNT